MVTEMDSNVGANNEKMTMGIDLLNVMADEVKPLPDHVLKSLQEGKYRRTQLLDGSNLEQHANLKPYAFTHVSMEFRDEDNMIRATRLLQWSDERMRARAKPNMMWAWDLSYREGMKLEFSVGWYSKEFFEENSKAFLDSNHASYYLKFGLTPEDIKTKNEILGK